MSMIQKLKTMLAMAKKGNIAPAIQTLIALILGLIIVGILGAYGQSTMSTIQATFVANTLAYNSTASSMSAVNQVTSNTPSLGSVGIAAVIISFLIGAFGGYFALR